MSSYNEIYVSVDIETDGLIPGENSVLAIGATAFKYVEREGWYSLGDFYVNLKPVSHHIQDPETMAWWAKQDQALWERLKEDAQHPGKATQMFYDWVHHLGCKKRIFLGWPASFDFAFVDWYFKYYIGDNPFGYQPLDIKSYAFGVLGTHNFGDATDRKDGAMVALGIIPENPKPHDAIEDAKHQAQIFKNLWEYHWSRR